jgi:hypothetical protein
MILENVQNTVVPEMDWDKYKMVSYTQFSAWSECPHKWKLMYIDKMRQPPNIHLAFGSAMHETLQEYLDLMYNKSIKAADEFPIYEDFQERFMKMYGDYKEQIGDNFATKKDLTEFVNDGLNIIEFFLQRRQMHFSKRGTRLLGVEMPILTPPHEKHPNIMLYGKLDLVFYDEDLQKISIWDIKTSTKGWTKWDKENKIKTAQMVLYKRYFAEQYNIPVESIDCKYFIVKRKIPKNPKYLNTVIKTIQARIFPFIIALSALTVSASAAFYSVSGLSKLFAGAAFAVIIMAASLEVAKLVIASLLYQYRKNLPKLLKYYLSVACFILILITSMGIYGFLSAAYQETAAKAGNVDSQIALIETKRDNIKEQLAIYNAEKESINEAVSSLRSGLSNNVIQYTDTLGNVITTTSSSTRRALEKQLDQAIGRQTEINTRVDGLNQQLFEYETEIVEVTSNASIAGELGPLKYLSGLTDKPMDQIINWLLLTIIFVFDPLAIALVIAANFAFAQLKPKKEKKVPSPHYSPQPFIPKPEIIEKEIVKKLPKEIQSELKDRIKHLKRAGKKLPDISEFLD